jgi:hypothetical protein
MKHTTGDQYTYNAKPAYCELNEDTVYPTEADAIEAARVAAAAYSKALALDMALEGKRHTKH